LVSICTSFAILILNYEFLTTLEHHVRLQGNSHATVSSLVFALAPTKDGVLYDEVKLRSGA
jgi:hypothetical protein